MTVRILALTALLLAAAVSPAGEQINPFTGAPISLEQARWALEQARLDEQLQSSLLNRRKFEVERQRLDLVDGAASMGAAAARSGDPVSSVGKFPGSGSPSTGLVASSDGLPPPRRTATELPARQAVKRQPAKARPNSRIVGVQAQAGTWCLLVEDPPDLAQVCPGARWAGQHLDSVSADQYVLDGVAHTLLVPVARLPSASPPFGLANSQFAASTPAPGVPGAVVAAPVADASGGEVEQPTALARRTETPLQVPAEWMR